MRSGIKRFFWSSKQVSASVYDRCPLTGGCKCRVQVEKSAGPQFGVGLREVSPSGGLAANDANDNLKGAKSKKSNT